VVLVPLPPAVTVGRSVAGGWAGSSIRSATRGVGAPLCGWSPR
jgi:hypothetical protein